MYICKYIYIYVYIYIICMYMCTKDGAFPSSYSKSVVKWI